MFKIFQHLFSFSNFPAPFSVKCLKVPSTFLFFTFCSTCPSLSDWVWCGMSCATNRWTDPKTCFETLLLFQTVACSWNFLLTCENPCCETCVKLVNTCVARVAPALGASSEKPGGPPEWSLDAAGTHLVDCPTRWSLFDISILIPRWPRNIAQQCASTHLPSC